MVSGSGLTRRWTSCRKRVKQLSHVKGCVGGTYGRWSDYRLFTLGQPNVVSQQLHYSSINSRYRKQCLNTVEFVKSALMRKRNDLQRSCCKLMLPSDLFQSPRIRNAPVEVSSTIIVHVACLKCLSGFWWRIGFPGLNWLICLVPCMFVRDIQHGVTHWPTYTYQGIHSCGSQVLATSNYLILIKHRDTEMGRGGNLYCPETKATASGNGHEDILSMKNIVLGFSFACHVSFSTLNSCQLLLSIGQAAMLLSPTQHWAWFVTRIVIGPLDWVSWQIKIALWKWKVGNLRLPWRQDAVFLEIYDPWSQTLTPSTPR